MQHIDKEIYKQDDVVKRLQPLNKWYYILSAFGIACTLPYLMIPNLGGAVSGLLLAGLSLGDFCLLTTICYYLFGDCRKAYDKENRVFWERTFDYYPSNLRPQLEEAMSAGIREEFDKIKRCPTSDLMVVRYDNEKSGGTYCQMLKQHESKEEPISEIHKLKH